jgi:hypothetical protein
MSSPKRRIPISKAVAGGFSMRLFARVPRDVFRPVRQMTSVAVLLTTDVPAKTALDDPPGPSVPVGTFPASFIVSGVFYKDKRVAKSREELDPWRRAPRGRRVIGTMERKPSRCLTAE